MVNLKSSFRKFCCHHHELVNRHRMSVPQMAYHYHGFVTKVRRLVTHVEQDLLTRHQTLVHPRFLVEFVLFNLQFSMQHFVNHCLSFCPFSFGHCVVCPFVLFPLAIVLFVLRFTASYLIILLSSNFSLNINYIKLNLKIIHISNKH